MTSDSSEERTAEKTSKEWQDKHRKKVQDFDKLLDAIDGASSREKMLWREIYDNAISDRQSADLCFLNLYPHLKRDIDKHIMGGERLSKYLERMNKANEQLLKLAHLIQQAVDKEDKVDEEALYEEMLKDADEDKQH